MFPCPHYRAEFDEFRVLEYHIHQMHDAKTVSHKFRCSTCDAEFLAETAWFRYSQGCEGEVCEPATIG